MFYYAYEKQFPMKRLATAIVAATIYIALFGQEKEIKYIAERLPDSWSYDNMFGQESPTDELWWRRFEDSQLDSLIGIACERNYSAIAAMENIRKAKAAWRQQQSSLFPSFDVNAGWQRNKSSGNIAVTDYHESWSGYFDANLTMSWEIDLFGKIIKRSQAQKKLYIASEEEYRALLTTICASVATSYFSLRMSLAEVKVLKENAASQMEIIKLVEARYNSGLASKLDVSQARSVYYSTLASIPPIEANILKYRNTLATLIATYPQEMNNFICEPQLPTVYIEPINIGIPAGIMRRRPDIRASEKQVEAYAAELGASKRDWLPSIYINGSLGFESERIKDIPRSQSLAWQITPGISWNIFDGGSDTYAIREAKAQLNQSIASFNNTVLTAVQEVENAMALYRNSVAQIIALRETVNRNRETLQLSIELYRQGLTEFQNVLDAQRTLLNYEETLVQAQGNSLITLIQLYKALGGGW